MAENTKANVVKTKQYRNLAILIGLVVAGFCGLVYMVSDDNNTASNNKSSVSKAEFADPLGHMDAESTVLERTQKKLKETELKSAHMQEQIDSLAKSKDDAANQANSDLKKRLEALEQQYGSAGIQPNSNPMVGNQEFHGDLLSPPTAQNGFGGQDGSTGQGIREDVLSLTPFKEAEENHVPLKNPDTYVPTGTFAKVMMLSGADASSAVTASHNPNPMLFRIVSDGILPNQKSSHLKGCFLMGSVAGDISSERGEITVNHISCVFANNEVVDTEIKAWIFGRDGKFGIRGRPVWREGKLLTRAFAAGALSGISEGISQTYTTNSISAQGNVATIDPSKMAQVGVGKGMGKAMDKLADYNIQRAEQYHPVIQISPGDVVDVVFSEGFFLDGKKHENTDTSIGNYAATIQTQGASSLFGVANQEAQTLPLSPDAVKRIQEHSKELGLRVTTQANG